MIFFKRTVNAIAKLASKCGQAFLFFRQRPLFAIPVFLTLSLIVISLAFIPFLKEQLPQRAAVVNMVQNGSVTMSSATQNVTITAVDTSKAFVVCNNRTNSSNASEKVTCNLTSSTNVQIIAGAANASNIVEWYVVEFQSGVTVQRGTSSMSGGTTSQNISISAVDTAKTFALVSSRTTSTSQTIDEQRIVAAQLTSSTNLQLQRAESGITSNIVWQVIQIDDANVQSGSTTIGGGSTSNTATISSVDTSKSFVVFSALPASSVNGIESSYYATGVLTNPTTLTFTRRSTTGALALRWFVVEMGDATTVQRGTSTASGTETTLNATVSAVDTGRTVPFVSTNVIDNAAPTGTADQDSGSWTPNFSSTTNLQLERGSAQDRPSTVAWQAVQFDNTPPPADFTACRTEGGTTTIPSGQSSSTLSLSTAVTDLSQAFLLVDSSGTSGVQGGDDHMVSGYISSTSQLTFERGSTVASQAEVSYVLVECFNNEIDVQRGEITIAASASSNTGSISTVNTANSIVLVNSRTADTANAEDEALATGELLNSTTVQVERAIAGSAATPVRYEVVQFSGSSGVSIQTGEISLNSGSASQSTSISSVDTTSTWVYCSWDASNNGLQQTAVGCELADATTVTAHRYASSAYTNRIRYYVIEFPNTQVTVQRGTEVNDPGSADDTLYNNDIAITPVTSVNSAFPYVTNTTSGTGTAYPRNKWIEYLTSTSNLRTSFWRGASTAAVDDNVKYWQVVEFSPSVNAPPTGSFNSATGGSGDIAFSIEVNDANDDDTRARIEYETDSDGACNGPWANAELTGPVVADFDDSGGSPDINNGFSYQLGQSTNTRIITSSGSNTVTLFWDSVTDLPGANGTQCLRLTTNDDTADQTTPDTVTVSVDNTVNLTQSAYRWFENDDSTDVGDPLRGVSQDSGVWLTHLDEKIRLRMLVHTSVTTPASSLDLKLQYAERGTDLDCDTSFTGETYQDVTALTPIAFYDNTAPSDGDSVTTNANDPTHGGDTVVAQTYEESNNFTNASTISSGQDGLWDFALTVDSSAVHGRTYCMRVVDNTGSPLATYSQIPSVRTLADAYISCDQNDRLFTLDISTGDTERVGDFGVPDVETLVYDSGEDVLYTADAGDFGTVDQLTGDFTLISNIDAAGCASGSLGCISLGDADGLALDAETRVLWASNRSASTNDVLFQIDPTTGQYVQDAFGPGIDYIAIQGMGVYDDVDDIAIRPSDGELFVTSNPGNQTIGNLLRVNKSTGVITVEQDMDIDDIEGLDYLNDGMLWSTRGSAGNEARQFDDSTAMTLLTYSLPGTCGDPEGIAALTRPANYVSGTVFEDSAPQNGTLDGGESGISGVTVNIYEDSNSNAQVDGTDRYLQSIVTDVNGEYSFYVGTTGEFVMEIDTGTLPASYSITTDNIEGAVFTDNVYFGETDTGNNFGANVDTDCDGDGIGDFLEDNPPGVDTDGDGVANQCDIDSDNDGIDDSIEGTNDRDEDGILNYLDLDSDNDGIPDALEANAGSAPSGYSAGSGRLTGTDTDGDGMLDQVDSLPSTQYGGSTTTLPLTNTDGDARRDFLDGDSDQDGILDVIEAGGTDSDGDGFIDGFTDTNSDGYHDPLTSSPLAIPNTDGTGGQNYRDQDSDGDGIPDFREGQTDAGYTVPPIISDADSDGLVDAFDYSQGGTPITPVDTDSDGMDDYVDTNSDNDGVPDAIEGHDADFNGVADVTATGSDTDGDGIDNGYDTDNANAQWFDNNVDVDADVQDFDSDSARDWRDDNDDDDGFDTINEDFNTNLDWSDDFTQGCSPRPDYYCFTQPVDLSVTKSVDDSSPSEGQSITYTVTITNGGPITASSIEVTDLLPSGVTYVSDTPSQGSYISGTGVWSVGSITNGSNATLDITATVDAATAGDTIQNTASLTNVAQGDSNASNNSDTADVTVNAADLEVVKTVDDGTPNEGDTIVWTVTVTNNGPDSTTNVTLGDLLPAGVSYVSDVPSQGSYVSGTGVWTIGSLASSQVVTLDITSTVDAGTGGTIITNTATVTNSDEGDPDTGDNSDSAQIDVQLADLSLSKSVDDSTPSEGDTIVFTLTLANAGPDSATGVAVTDLIPSGLTYVSDTPSQGSYIPGTGVWSVGTVTNGSSPTLDITATVDGGTGGSAIENDAEVTASDTADPDSTPNNTSGAEDDEDFVTVNVQSADLSLTKIVDDSTPDEGQNVTFTITVANSGPDNATTVVVTDLLPSGLSYVSDSPSQGSYVSSTGIWTVGTVNNGSSATLNLTASVDAGQAGNTIQNYAEVTASDQGDIDSTPNNGSTTEDDDDSVDLNVTEIDIAVTKSVDDGTPNEGDTVQFTVAVTNNGPDAASGVEITDLLPSGVTYVSHTQIGGGTYTPGTGVWSVGNLPVSASVSLFIDASVDAGTGGTIITNTAAVTDSDQGDSTPANDSDSAQIDVQLADLSLTKTVDNAAPDEGETVTFTLTVANAGPDSATNVSVSDLLPSGVTYVSDTPSQGSYVPGTGLWTVGTIGNGSSATLDITATVDAGTAGTQIINNAEVSTSDVADHDSTPGNTSGAEDDEDSQALNVMDADIGVTKVVDDSNPNVGDTITYTITATNNGPDSGTNIQVTDLLPAGVTYVSDTPSQGTYVPGTGVWGVGSLANGGSATLDISATVDAGTGGTNIVNTATFTSADQGDSNPANDSDTADIDVQSADLELAKIVDDNNPSEGDTVTYTLTITNNGPDDADNIQVTDLLPSGVTYASDTPSQGTYVPGTGVWTAGTVANGGSATLDISVTVDAGTGASNITNDAEVTAADQEDPDSTPNNSSTTEDDDASATLLIQSADLEVVKTVDNGTPNEGDTVVWTVAITNNGPDATTNVAITDLLPAGLTYVSNAPSQGAYAPGTGIWAIGTLASSQQETLDITATVDAGTQGTIITNVAMVTATDQGDPDVGDNSDSAQIDVQSADLSLTKSVDVPGPGEGDTVVYTITVANGGPDSATNITVTDLLPSGVTYVSDTPSQGSYVSGTGVWTVGTVGNGSNATLDITATVDSGQAGNSIDNDAEVTSTDTADPDSTPGNTSGTEDDEDTASITVQDADLGITKVVDDAAPDVGQAIVYTLTITNNGPDNATGVEVTDILPSGLTYVNATPSQGSYTTGTGVWSVGSLTNGSSANMNITATVDAGQGGNSIVNTATITDTDQGDSNPANDSDSDQIDVTLADLSLTKVVDNATPSVSDTVTYTVTVSNTGPDSATGVEVTDLLPAGVTYVSNTPSQGSYVPGTGIWTVGTIGSGGSATLDISATVDAGTAATTIDNDAEVTDADPEDPDSTPGNTSGSEDDEDSASITVRGADLGIVKIVDDATPNEGDTVVYTLTITNNGPDNTTGVQVTDSLPSGVTYVSNTPSQGTYTPGSGVWNVGSLTNGSNATLTITATVDAGTQGSMIINTSTITANNEGDSNAANDTDTANINVRSADLSLSKVASDTSPSEGDTVTYTLTITNGGPDQTMGVTLSDVLPSGVTYVSDNPSQGSYDDGTGIWSVGTIGNGASATLEIDVTVDSGTAGQSIVNSAEITASDVDDPDSTPGNTSGTEDDEDSIIFTVEDADLGVTKNVDIANPNAGDVIVYTVVITNNGPDDASGVELTDLLPSGVSYVNATPSQGSYTPGTGVWSVGLLTNGSSANMNITASVDAGTGGSTIINTATLTGSNQGDSVPGNNSDTAQIDVQSADLELSKVADDSNPSEGDTVVYTLTVTNNGPDGAENVEVTDQLPSGVTYVSDTPSQGSYVSGTGLWTVGTIANGGSATLNITATVDAGTAASNISNSAEVTDVDQEDPDSTPGNASTSEDDDDSVSLLVQAADLEVVKTVDNAAPDEGDTVVWTVTVTNNGPNDTTGVALTDSLPAGLTYVSDAPSQGSYVPGTGVWSVGALTNGSNATLQITSTVDAGTQGQNITNTATVTGSDQGDPDTGDNSDSDNIVVKSADLSLDKTVDNSNPGEGGTVVYTLTLTNSGPDSATGVTVTDLLPSGVTYVSNTPSQGSYVPGTGIWTVGTVNNGSNATLDITATVDAGTAGQTIGNDAEVTASDTADPDSTPGNTSGTEDDEDSQNISIAEADLGITKTVDDATPDVGDAIVFTITVTNNGPDGASTVEVTDVLPSGLTYVNATPSQGTYDDGTGIWSVGSLTNGSSANMNLTATVDAGEGGNTIVNTSTITNSDQGDSNSANDSDSDSVTVTLSDLVLSKVVDDSNPAEGDAVTFTLTLQNNGPDNATGVAVTDLLPSGLTYASATPSQGTYDDGTGVWTAGTIANGGSATLNITATVDAGTAAGTIDNDAEISASDQEDPDSTPNNSSTTEDDDDSVSLLVQAADLEVVKVVDEGAPNEGDTVVFTITVSNNGPDDTTGVEITDALPSGLTYVSDTPSQGTYDDGTGVWTVGAINNGGSANLSITATVDAGTGGSVLTNTATITDSDQGDPDTGDNSDSADVDVQLADLELEKTVDDANPTEGGTVVYTLTVVNGGPDSATNITVTDLLPSGVTYVSDTPSQGSYVSGTGVWTVGTVANGGNATLDITATVDSGTLGTSIDNDAEVTASDVADHDSTPNNASGTEDDEDTATITILNADLGIVKNVDDANPQEGDTVTYTLTITDNGPDNATGIEISDTIPSGLTYLASTPSQGTYDDGTGVWTVGAINNGANATLNISASVNTGTAGDTILNTASVSAVDQGDSNSANNSDDASLTVQSADLAVQKSVDDDTPYEGDDVVFTITVTNDGPSDTTGVALTDNLPAGLTYVSDTPSQGTYDDGTGVWSIGALTNGSNATLSVTAEVDTGTNGGLLTNTASVTASDVEDANSANDSASANVAPHVRSGGGTPPVIPDVTATGGIDIPAVCVVDLDVDVELNATGATQYIISDNPSLTGGVWQPFTNPTHLTWFLQPGDGEKTVYAVFRSSTGNISSVVSDTVTVDSKNGCVFPPPEPEPEPEPEPPVEEGACEINCRNIYYDLFIVNPDGTERHMNTRFAREETIGPDQTLVGFEDKGEDFDYNDVQVTVDQGDCSQITFDLEIGDAVWHHEVWVTLFYEGTDNSETVQLWPDSHIGDGTRTFVNAYDYPGLCELPPPPPPGQCDLDCSRLIYDVYIINPDGTERHMNSEYAQFDNYGGGRGLVRLEDKGEDFDYNDVLVAVDKSDCSEISFNLSVGDADWDHEVRAKLLYAGTSNEQDVLLWSSSQEGKGTRTFVNAEDYPDLCLERVEIPECRIDCSRLSYDLYIVNPDGTERHMNTPFTQQTELEPDVLQISYEDKGIDLDYNDVTAIVDKRECTDIKISLDVAREAAWDHQVRTKLFYEGSSNDEDILLWTSSQAAAGSTFNFDANDYPRLCEGTVVPSYEPCDIVCSQVTYDLFIELPDGTERHMFSDFSEIENVGNNTVLVKFEDRGIDFDYDDVWVEVNRSECENIRFRVDQVNATLHHKIKARWSYRGVEKEEIILWPDSHEADETRVINVNEFPALCLETSLQGQFQSGFTSFLQGAGVGLQSLELPLGDQSSAAETLPQRLLDTFTDALIGSFRRLQ